MIRKIREQCVVCYEIAQENRVVLALLPVGTYNALVFIIARFRIVACVATRVGRRRKIRYQLRSDQGRRSSQQRRQEYIAVMRRYVGIAQKDWGRLARGCEHSSKIAI